MVIFMDKQDITIQRPLAYLWGPCQSFSLQVKLACRNKISLKQGYSSLGQDRIFLDLFFFYVEPNHVPCQHKSKETRIVIIIRCHCSRVTLIIFGSKYTGSCFIVCTKNIYFLYVFINFERLDQLKLCLIRPLHTTIVTVHRPIRETYISQKTNYK